MTDQTRSARRLAAPALAAAPPRDVILGTFLALALTPFCWALLLRQQGVNPVLVAGLFAQPYCVGVLLLAHADQNVARAQRSTLDKLAVLLLLVIYPLNALPYWFAARHLARYPIARRALWASAAIVVAWALFTVDWTRLLV